MKPWPEIKNNSLQYILALTDAMTSGENGGVQESSTKTVNGLNMFNFDVGAPHLSSVGTSVASTFGVAILLYFIYRTIRYCVERRQARDQARRQAWIQMIEHARTGGAAIPAEQAAAAALQAATNIPGTPGAAAGVAARLLDAASGSEMASAPPTYEPKLPLKGEAYPSLVGYSK